MKNSHSMVVALLLLCVTGCSGGSLYIPQPDIDTVQPSSQGGTGTGNPNDANGVNPNDLSQSPPAAPNFQATIDGNAFVPRSVYYASGQDPQKHPVLMLVVSDQNDLCSQLTTPGQQVPGAQTLAMYLYTVGAATTGNATVGMPVAPETLAGTYAVFDSAAANADVSANPANDIPGDAGDYVSGSFYALNATCGRTGLHQLAEGSVTVNVVDTASGKASGSISVLLDDSVSLSNDGNFVAQTCPGILSMAQAFGCTTP